MLRLVLLLLLIASPVLAQQQPQQDPQIMIYRQLLDNANAQLATVAAQLQAAQEKIKQLEAQQQPDKK